MNCHDKRLTLCLAAMEDQNPLGVGTEEGLPSQQFVLERWIIQGAKNCFYLPQTESTCKSFCISHFKTHTPTSV